MKADRAPNEASPAIVLAADPPERSSPRFQQRVEVLRLLRIDQAHIALAHLVLGQEGIVAASDDVDDGIANADNIVASVRHLRPPNRTPDRRVRRTIGSAPTRASGGR